jgi:hypothetical protein
MRGFASGELMEKVDIAEWLAQADLSGSDQRKYDMPSSLMTPQLCDSQSNALGRSGSFIAYFSLRRGSSLAMH